MARNKAKIEITAKDKTKGAFRSVNKGLKSVTSSVFSTTTAIAGLVGVAGFGALISNSLAVNDALAKTADKLGITTKALSGLQHAAELSGVSSKTLDTSLQRLTRRLSEVATTGGGPAAKALETLGLSAKSLLEVPLEQQMGAIADSMKLLPTQADKVRVAFGLFDTEGVNLVNTLKDGSEGLKLAAIEAEKLGKSISRIDAAKIEAANDAFFKVETAVKGVVTQLTIQLAPILQAVSNEFVNTAKNAGNMSSSIIKGIENIVLGFGYFANAIRGIEIIFIGLKLAFALVVREITKDLETLVKGFTSFISIIPGVGDALEKVNEVVGGIARATANTVSGFQDEINAVLAAPLPTDAIQAKFSAIKEAAQINAVALSTITLDANTKEQAAQLEHNSNIVQLENERTRQIVANRKKELAQLEKFNALSWQGQTKQVSGELVKMTQGVASSSKAMFKINKAAGIANAIINTSQGVTNALAAYPPPLSFAMAAAQLAAGVAQIGAIKSTSFGGGGSVPSLSGSGAGGSAQTAVLADNAPGQNLPLDENGGSSKIININFGGQSRYSKDEVRDLIDQINVEIGDGATLVAS